MAIKAVAFDAFGTLVEIGDKRRPFEAILRLARSAPARSPMVGAVGLAELARACDVAPDPRHASDLAAELASIAPYPEARPVLIALRKRGLRIAVASNLALPYAQPLRDQLGDLVDTACLSFEVGHVKPDPAFYRALCRQLNLAPAEVLMVGDTWRCDYLGASAAGLQALHLDRRGNATPEQAAVSIRDLTGVLG
ncbi:HAD-IA family hydrolase [Massilia sp. CCM 8733]|uniref:HAD-IA family hydrolase n=1 Tax=Massilia mucilaginosa TaxID=2609282 RepID=A0ABX0NX04_9BURK|nr:HAD family hydrolase [Massilia mucilaginosa]NHZ91397.1 HAD-IA family hydrolase [Massilia mucilaginosa]